MRFQFFRISAISDHEGTAELNQFVASHRLISVDRQFVANGSDSYWAICVTWQEGAASTTATTHSRDRGKVDYRQVLPEAEFRVFALLRSLRKEIAEKESVPAYALFTNEQLASIVRQRVTSLSMLARIDGVGPARVEKYGQQFIEVMKNECSLLNVETGIHPDEKNSRPD